MKLNQTETLLALGTAILSAGISWGVANAKVEALEKQADIRALQFEKLVEQVNLINERTIRIEERQLNRSGTGR